MAVKYWVGSTPLDMSELKNIVDSSSSISLEDYVKNKHDIALQNDFKKLGIGEPINIRLETVYVGDLVPGSSMRKRDVLVVSGIKSSRNFESVGRAVNLIHDDATDFGYLSPGAFREGSPIVYYKKSLTDDAIVISFELISDTFKEDTFAKIQSLFQNAGGLPIFVPASTYLLAGSFLVGMISDLGKAFKESAPSLADDLELTFGVSGRPDFQEGVYSFVGKKHSEELDEYEPKLVSVNNRNSYRMVHKTTGEIYKGNAQYILVLIDGSEKPMLEDFEPKLASASLIEKYYPTKDGFGTNTKEILEALTLYNDLEYKKKAETMKLKLISMSPEDSNYSAFKDLFNAYRNNIRQKEFKVEELPTVAGG